MEMSIISEDSQATVKEGNRMEVNNNDSVNKDASQQNAVQMSGDGSISINNHGDDSVPLEQAKQQEDNEIINRRNQSFTKEDRNRQLRKVRGRQIRTKNKSKSTKLPEVGLGEKSESCYNKSMFCLRDKKEHQTNDPNIRDSSYKRVRNYSVENGKKVYMSEADISKLRQLKSQYRKRELKIQEQLQVRQSQLKLSKIEQNKSKEIKLKIDKQQRLNQIRQRLCSRSQKRSKTLDINIEGNKKIKQLKNSVKLFEKMQLNFSLSLEKQKTKRQAIIEQKVNKQRVDYEDLKRKQKQYMQDRSLRIQRSRERLKENLKSLEEEFGNANLHRSRFYESVKDEKKVILKSWEKNLQKPKQYADKIREYEQVVREKHAPKGKVRLQIKERKTMPIYEMKDIISMGNSYMKRSLQLVDRSRREKSPVDQLASSQGAKSNYIDYLKEMRNSSVGDSRVSQNEELSMKSVDERVREIMESKDNQRAKWERLQELQEKVTYYFERVREKEGNNSLKSADSDIEEIRVKMRIVQALQSFKQQDR